jgi:predicted RNA-binding Zn-ribbon protein involved in translation (DUF1610 family)
MTWPERDDDDRGFTEHRRRFVCVVCQRILLRKDQVVRRQGKVFCPKCAQEADRAS